MARSTYTAHETRRAHALEGRELASFGARAAAFVLDFAIAGLLFGVGFMIVGVPIARLLVRAGILHVQNDVMLHLNFFHNWYSLVWLVLYFGLATYFGNGRTPGKGLLRIRVVSLLHERLTLWHAIERALGYGASALEFGFGFAQYFIHPNRQTVHDRIADTIVVADGARQAPPRDGSRDGSDA